MWVWHSLTFALYTALSTFLIKRLSKTIDPLPLLYMSLLFTIPMTFVLLLLLGGVPKVTNSFYMYVGASAALDTVAFICSFLAISRSSISLISPVASFGPVFTTIIATFTLGEIPTPIKFMGILLVVFGAYLLNVADIKEGIMAPFKKLFSHKGVLLFLIANFLWSITPIFQKKAIFETSPQVPLFVSVIGMGFVFLLLTPFALKRAFKFLKEVRRNLKWFFLNGVGGAISQAAAYAAFATVFVGYATSIFRTSSLFIIVLGGLFLKEERIKERLLGASVMLLGAILLAL